MALRFAAMLTNLRLAIRGLGRFQGDTTGVTANSEEKGVAKRNLEGLWIEI